LCPEYSGGRPECSGKSPHSAENIVLRNSQYNYNDDVLMTGAEFFAELIRVGFRGKDFIYIKSKEMGKNV